MSLAPTRLLCPLALMMALLLLPWTARADNPLEKKSSPTQAVSFDPIWLLYSTLAFQYERLMAPSGSLAIKARLGITDVTPQTGEPYERTVVGIGVGYHFFPQAGAPLGFYGAPGIDLLQRYQTTKTKTGSVFIAVPFVELGYNWAHRIGLYAGGSIGMQYIIGNVKEDTRGLDTLSGFVPRVSPPLGYAW